MSGHGQNIPAHTAPLPTPAADDSQKLVIVGIVGSALALLGSFLAWVSVDVDGGSETIGGTDGDGVFTLITSALAIVLLVVGMVKKNAKLAAASVLPSLVTLVFGVLNFASPTRLARTYVENEVPDASSEEIDGLLESFDFSPTVGLYIVLLGSVVALIAGVMVGLKARSSN